MQEALLGPSPGSPPRVSRGQTSAPSPGSKDRLAQVAGRLAPGQHHPLEDRDGRVAEDEVRVDFRRVPSPLQSRQTPKGLLKGGWSGSSSGNDRPHTAQENARKAGTGCAPCRRAAPLPDAIGSFSAVGSSRRGGHSPRRTTSRVDHHGDVVDCRWFIEEAEPRSWVSPSTRTRTNHASAHPRTGRGTSPFRPRTSAP